MNVPNLIAMAQPQIDVPVSPSSVSIQALLEKKLSGDAASEIGFVSRNRSGAKYREESQTDFLARALRLGQKLSDSGVKKTDPVVIACATPRVALTTFLATVAIGGHPAILPLRPAFDDAKAVSLRLQQAVKALGPQTKVVVENPKGKPLISEHEANPVLQVNEEVLDNLTGAAASLQHSTGISHFQLTSGSTGECKAIAMTHQSVVANINAISMRTEAYGPEGAFAGWLPLYHDMGLISQAIAPLLLNTATYIMSPYDFLAKPLSWLHLVSSKRATVSASPTFGYDLVTTKLLEEEQPPNIDLSSWISACCGAEPVSAKTAQRFIDAFRPYGLRDTAFSPSYGLAEATLAVTITRPDEPLRTISVKPESLTRMTGVALTDSADIDSIQAVSVGTPVDGVSIEIIDSADQAVQKDLTCGEIVVTGESIAKGQVHNSGTIQEFDGRFRTGDLGFVHDGELYVIDRLKNTIIRNGHNYSATIIEDRVAEFLGMSSSQVVAVDADILNGKDLTVLIEVGKGQNAHDLASCLYANREAFDPPVDYAVFVKKGSLPRTTSGKKRHLETRVALNSKMLSEQLHVEVSRHTTTSPTLIDHAQSTSIELGEVLKVVANFARARGTDAPVVGESTLRHDLDFDSLAMLELAVTIEDAFDLSMPRELMAETSTVAELADAIHLAKSEDPGKTNRISDVIKNIRAQIPQNFTTADEVAKNRRVLIEGRWFDDFASACYLGLDENEEIIERAFASAKQWGMHRGWTRAVSTPKPIIELETKLAKLVGAPDVTVFGTVTLLHMGVLPLLAGETGALILDTEAHKSMHEAAGLARSKGTTVTTFRHGDIDDLKAKLSQLGSHDRRIVVLDGVYSMKGSALDLATYQSVAKEFDATLYIDDAHGFGVIGESPSDAMPLGFRGNGLVKHAGCSYENIIYVGGLTKAYSSTLAFVTCDTPEVKQLVQLASTMVFVHAPPLTTVAQALAGLEVNDSEGDQRRERLYQLTHRFISGVRALGFHAESSHFPIVNVVLGDVEAVVRGANVAWEHGLLMTPSVFPAAPLDRGGLRFTLTATNTNDQVDRALAALATISTATHSRLNNHNALAE
jgi:acyl carrier protein